ncbi:MAG: YcgN family cysteine cluster protein [Alphaproteobacteria bacterium]|nr:YcgN family cysteine cluster protein [Alphaproteobacteria bacterium]
MLDKFWLHTSLEKMTDSQWESLCDGCGKCCLEKIEDIDTGEIYTSAVSCRLLNPDTCRCASYDNRFKYMEDCIKITPKKVYEIKWLPKTCAYRLIKEKKDLPAWHPLITNNPNSTIASGNSACEFVIHPSQMRGEIIDYIIDEDI